MDSTTLLFLRQMQPSYPNVNSALTAIANLEAELTLNKPTVHVISDIHGEFQKLKHVINNASGSLRPLVNKLFGASLSEAERAQLLNLIHYPRETYTMLYERFETPQQRGDFLLTAIGRQAIVLQELAKRYSLDAIEGLMPQHFRSFFREILFAPQLKRSSEYIAAAVREFVNQGRELELLRHSARLIRNMLIHELVIAGDFGDRGPRLDRVLDFVMRQPQVAITWGNHDVSWLGACLGHLTCIATVIRISLRYRRLSQLEEGYGIPMAPLEKLARTVYADDEAARFPCKGEGLRDALLMARMQKAIAIIQFKLEGQLIQRNPHYGLKDRNLLHRIDINRGTVCLPVSGQEVDYKLLDTRFPTIDWAHPYELSPEEKSCIERLRESFLLSPTLWQHMQFLVRHGAMWLERDGNLIFHGCVPCDEEGNFLTFAPDGRPCGGKQLFQVLQRCIVRALREKRGSDLDLLWYLWGGPRSPLFGKDKMATFEGYFVAEKETHKEVKNPYFSLIHEMWFCEKVLAEFGVKSKSPLIVNGHVPVKIESGESPLKKSELAVTIDGAFSEAYGDKGYTLVLEADRTFLAQHHHFDSIADSISQGTDIIPTITEIRRFDPPRRNSDTDRGADIRERIRMLRLLAQAYEEGLLPELD